MIMALGKKHDFQKMVASLTDEGVPLEHRMRMTAHLCMDQSAENKHVIGHLFELAAKNNGEALYEKKLQELSNQIKELKTGPLRSAMFQGLIPANGNGTGCRARVALEDGATVYPVVANGALAAALHCGDLVLLDGQAKAILARDPVAVQVGEEARLERQIDAGRVEVVLRDHEPHVFQVAAKLAAKFKSSAIQPGSRLLVDPRRQIALDYVPAADGMSHFWYLVREPVPDVIVARDIGSPPPYIEELADHVRLCMLRPEILTGYKIRMAQTKLLQGVSGSGKTLSINGFWRRMYEVMSEITGLAIAQLPPRVLRLRTSDVYVKWFGDSERRLARFFSEVEQLADEPIVGADGVEYRAPVLAICEEFDAVGRTRGTGEPIGERIQATILERLDVNSPRFRDRLVIVLATTNVPHLVDPALVRRVGGTVANFGRLRRRQFMAVLGKQLRALKFKAAYGPPADAERRVVHNVTDWLYAHNGHDAGQLQITYVGSSTPDVKYRRDLVTGALVDRAVQQAARQAGQAEFHGAKDPGVSCSMIVRNLDGQLRSVVDLLTPRNVHDYVAIPDGARVGSVRRLQQPSVLPFDLERDS
jgi:ATP-dependent 26S proteasome regulatory subunit